jgi:hypothetical protein
VIEYSLRLFFCSTFYFAIFLLMYTLLARIFSFVPESALMTIDGCFFFPWKLVRRWFSLFAERFRESQVLPPQHSSGNCWLNLPSASGRVLGSHCLFPRRGRSIVCDAFQVIAPDAAPASELASHGIQQLPWDYAP